MADLSGYFTGLLAGDSFVTTAQTGNPTTNVAVYNVRALPAQTFYYQMEGFDAVLTTKITWVVQGAPDFTATSAAALAAIAAASASTPLRNVCITSQWPVPIS